ncbi:MAG: hypothetical protein BGN92_02220 [Sphingobacteriales bacterium 41-5]|nr:MAG: hypothetical protein BGN92_02220 [Sphingobacteriales bacterium 41-5]
MKKTTLLLSMAAGIFLSACNSNQTSEKVSATDTLAQAAHHEETAAASEDIELNNGDKWVVNEEMKPYVAKGAELTTAFIQDNGSDYNKLAVALKAENDQLIKSCTMQGKSHDELHKWLHPHLEFVKKLETAKNETEGNELVQQLEKSYQDYHTYFQ